MMYIVTVDWSVDYEEHGSYTIGLATTEDSANTIAEDFRNQKMTTGVITDRGSYSRNGICGTVRSYSFEWEGTDSSPFSLVDYTISISPIEVDRLLTNRE